MQNILFKCLTLTVFLLLTACQSIDNFLTDSGTRQHSDQYMVVKPVPKTQISEVKNNNSFKNEQSSSIPSAPTSTKNDVKTVKITPSKTNSQNMVPNVAPSFGE